VCSITHGAILPGWPATCQAERAECSRSPSVREELIAPTTAILAAMKRNKNSRTRNRDDADVRFEFMIVEHAGLGPFYSKAQRIVNTLAL
jgi:hypothetical protein